MLKKKFNISEKEYVEFANATLKKSNLKIAGVTGTILFAGTIAFSYKDGLSKAIILAIILTLIYFLIVFGVLFTTTPFMAKRTYHKRNIDKLSYELEFNSDGVRQNKEIFLYSQFKKIVETKLAFHFILQDRQIIVVSKRAFNEDELAELRTLLSSNKNIKNLKINSTNKK